MPGYRRPTWTGVIAPAGVPRAIVDKLNAAINRAIKSQAFQEKFAVIGDEPGGGTPEEFAAMIKMDSAKWGDADQARRNHVGVIGTSWLTKTSSSKRRAASASSGSTGRRR